MKKLLLTIVSAFLLFALSAQVSEDFSDYTVGGKIAQQAQAMGRDYWTTWSNKPGTNEDGVVGEMPAGNKCGKFDWVGSGTVDQVLKLGKKTSGKWELTLKIYVPTGQCGYFNILSDFKGSQSKWSFQIYFSKDGAAPGVGTMDAGGADAASFTFDHDTWIPVKLIMDLDLDLGEVFVNDTKVHEWIYTKGTFGDGSPRCIDALDIYPTTAGKSTFYIDDIDFKSIGDPTSAKIEVTPVEISDVFIPLGLTETKTIKLENTGTAIGDYLVWVNFGEGTEGTSSNYTLTYSDDEMPPGGNIGFITPPAWVEVAANYPVSHFCDKVGTYIKKLSYYVPDSEDMGGDPLVFRIYGPQIDNTGPGELLLEEELSTYTPGTWNEVTLSTPFLLDGRQIWISVYFSHPAGSHPIACDAVANGINWIRYANASWHNWDEYGDFMIKGLLEGKKAKACWVNFTGNSYGSVPIAGSKTFNVVLSTTGLAEGAYQTDIILETNDPINPVFTIPCSIIVGNSAIMSVVPDSINMEITGNDSLTIQVKVKNAGNIAGDYRVIDPGLDWLELANNAGTVDAGKDETFEIIITPAGLANNTYPIKIKIDVTEDVYKTEIELPCTFVVNKNSVEKYTIKTVVYPNPATNSVTVKSNQIINNVQVINFVGQTVISTPVNKDQININTSNLSSGIYFLRVNTDAGSQNVKLIIK